MIGVVPALPSPPRASFFACSCAWWNVNHGLAVAIFEVVGECEALGPVGAVAVADLEHPRSVGLVAAVQQEDAARQRRAAVGLRRMVNLFSRALRLSIALKLTLRAMKFVSPFSRSVAIVSVKACGGA